MFKQSVIVLAGLISNFDVLFGRITKRIELCAFIIPELLFDAIVIFRAYNKTFITQDIHFRPVNRSLQLIDNLFQLGMCPAGINYPDFALGIILFLIMQPCQTRTQ